MSIPHFLFMVLICLVWGFTFVAGKAGVGELPPILFTGCRYLLLSAMLWPWMRIVKGHMLEVFVISLCMGGVHFALFYTGMSVAQNVSTAAVVTQLGLPFTLIMSVLFLREQIGWRRISGILLAFGGILIINFDPAVIAERLGLVLIVGSAFVGAIGTILMKRISMTGVYQLQSWIAFFSWPLLFIVSGLIEQDQLAAIMAASWKGWGGVVYTAVGASLIGHAGMYYLIQRYDVSVISPLSLMAPVFGVVLGVLVWGDDLGPRFWLGGFVTLSGVLIIALRRRSHPVAGTTLSV